MDHADLLHVRVSSSDIDAARDLVRHIELKLRAPDAIHLATAQRLGATLATFDVTLASAARALGVEVEDQFT